MPDSLRLPARRTAKPLTAAAAFYTPETWRSGQLFGALTWQLEAWNFRRTLGEFNQAIDWESRAMSRIRLTAAEVVPGGDEPEPLEEGAAAQLMQDFCGGPPGHSAFLRAITPQLLVPGEGWLIAERDDPRLPLSAAEWGVYSTECVQALGTRFRVRVNQTAWRDLEPDNLPMRIYEPDPQYPWLATSNAEAAVPIMRRIFLIDSRIVAMMVSRLVMNGLMLIPQEGTFSVPEQYKQAPDPFVAMLIDIASKNIANPGLASAGIPIPVRFTADLIEKWKILKADDPLDEWLLKERLDELGRLGDTLGVARERVTGGIGEANHWCVDDQTEILTTDGWRRHDDLNAGDIALTLNHETGLSEWQPVESVNRWDVIDEPMVSMERQNHSSLTTLSHRWPVLRPRWTNDVERLDREWITSEKIDRAHRLITAAPSADLPTEVKHSDDLVELVAWFWTEGNISTTGGVTIAQSHTRNPARVDRIRACLTRAFGPAAISRLRPDVAGWRETIQANRQSHGGPVTIFRLSKAAGSEIVGAAPSKRVDLGFVRSLTRAQLELFIDVSCQGDGWHYSSGRLDIWQKEHDALDAYELALILSGRMVTNTIYAGGRCVSPWSQSVIRPMKSLNGEHDQCVESYTGTIWCPTTPSRTWLARRNGTVYFTGNSAWQISEEEVRISFAPLAETICGAISKAYLRPMLRASGQSLVGDRGGKLICWYDVSELTARPDKTEPAFQLYDRGLITETAVRRETGFDESDALVEPEELKVWVLKKVAGTAELAPTSLAELSGFETPAVGGAPPAAASDGVASAPVSPVPPTAGPPRTIAEPPPAPNAGPPSTASAVLQKVLVEVGHNGNGAHPAGR